MIRVVQADITTLAVDAIVNAANGTLLGGGGVDGAIHRAAGPRLQAACRDFGGCPTGEARITPGFDLPADFVIHTVGPIWQGGQQREPDLLRSCYAQCFEVARVNGVLTIAFPGISTGVYGYPKHAAAHIAVSTMSEVEDCFEEIICCCFSDDDVSIYTNLIDSRDEYA
ncbi:MAG: O-acetyl-ADP-ribose deacetylase [Gammaproteobacteria bacterium]|nr:O-acetyl-ADP-ribose deacetylase [Gammaproteobacteria bacterium]MDH3379714.1 O-acetyl-ADP-ribose deacetylase [Gammaproteobacteria bacterium]